MPPEIEITHYHVVRDYDKGTESVYGVQGGETLFSYVGEDGIETTLEITEADRLISTRKIDK